LASADNFGVEEGMGEKAANWMNTFSKKNGKSYECKLERYSISTLHFGNFEVLSWKGEWSDARRIIVKASHKLSMKVIEGGYHRKGNYIGTLILGKKSGHWIVKFEKQG
jgi:hypothetical protein